MAPDVAAHFTCLKLVQVDGCANKELLVKFVARMEIGIGMIRI